jgi:hypothetical protein
MNGTDMNTTNTAKTLYRRLVLPVRAVRACLGDAADQDPAVVAHHTDKVVPVLAAAADRVAVLRRRVADTTTRMERKRDSAAAKRHRREALADAVVAVDGVHEDLTAAIRSLSR